MARICYTCDSFCVYLIIFLRILSVVSNRDYDFYETDATYQQETRIDLVSLDGDVHNDQKRDVSDILSNTENTVNSTKSTNFTTVKPTLLPPKKQRPKPQLILSINEGRQNLGVNGTGQRINVTSPPSLIENRTLLSTPITDDKTNDDDESTTPLFPSDLDTETGEKLFNATLQDRNITTSTEDNYTYYNSTTYNEEDYGHHYWVNFANRTDVKENKLLSHSHRRAATIQLSFQFPFYGHLIKNVTIATGGFLYTGDYVHSWLAATQYIAPLMANFDTSLSNDSHIKYLDNGTALTVEWHKVPLQEKPHAGGFTFQTILKNNGDIVFIYKEVPLLVRNIKDSHHPVKVGLSDAYIMDRTAFLIRRKTIFEYHRVDFTDKEIKNWTVIYLKALPTCLDNHDCTTCLTKEVFSRTKCMWCPTLKKCSSGYDRHRQDWTTQDCDKKGFKNETMCSLNGTEESFPLNSNDYVSVDDMDAPDASQVYSVPVKKPQDDVGISGIVAVLFLAAMVTGLAVWVFYAYRNPHTTSGQILIRYRPSQWRWRRGEARYTAATIHM